MDEDTAKKPRVSRACEPCRKRKTRCDGQRPACNNCLGSGRDCMYTEVVQKRKAKVTKENNSRSSKSRLDRIESLLDKVLRRLGDDRLGDAADIILRHNGSEFVSRRASPQSDSESDNETSENSEDEPRTSSKNESTSFIYPFKAPSSAQRGDTFSHTMERCQDRAFGGSSVFAVFSPSGLQWLSDRAGSPGIKQHMLGVFTKVFSKMHLKLRDFVEPIPEPLLPDMPEEYVEALTNHFFDAVNYISGILDREDWNQIVAAFYNKPGSRPNGYAELYLFWTLVLITTDFLHSVVEECKVASACFTRESILTLRKAALANSIFFYTRIMSLGGSFHALQGTLLLAMYFFSTPIPHGVHLAVNTAARLAIDLGLHRREGYTHLPPKVARLRMRNWWLVYTMDRDLSLRSGIPPVIHDNDVSTPSPDSCDVGDDEGIDYIKWGDGHKTSYAQLLHGLSRISSKVYSQLYSASAARKSPEKISECIIKLDRELTQWRECLPAHLRPGTDVMVFDCSKGYADVHEADNSMRSQIVEWHSQFNSLWVHFNYYFLQSAIHRTSVYHPTWYSRKILGKGEKTGNTPNGGTPMSASSHEDTNKGSPNPRLFSSHSICVQAARNTIYLTRNIPVKLMSCFWSFSFFLLSAFTILLIHVLQRPLEATIRADLELMKIAIDFLKSLPDGEEFSFLLVFTEFYDVAVKFVDTAQERHKKQEAGEKLDPNTALDKLVYSTPTSIPPNVSSSQPQLPQQQLPQQQQQQQQPQQQQASQQPQQHATPSSVDSTYNMMVNDFYPQQQQTAAQTSYAPVDYPQGQPDVLPEMYSRPGNEWYFDMYQSGFMDYGNYNYEG
ncbi:YALIA101S08e01772g1_1 [Yarrowia lipolytica]|nr:Putative transcriptional regulatory protein [Yarrowia lipolytica]SEI35716.1 YALIA101S08e01772g1_1 [Yarrowia lipolytica]